MFGEYIKEIRTNKSLTLRETAKRTKVSHPYLSQLERGENKKPSPEIIKKLAEGLNVNYAHLMNKAGYLICGGIESFSTQELIDELKNRKENISGVQEGDFI